MCVRVGGGGDDSCRYILHEAIDSAGIIRKILDAKRRFSLCSCTDSRSGAVRIFVYTGGCGVGEGV